ncbi:MAG: hypothetical protein U0R44_05805 [Candidatus Micrarchaeia archaeon]
MEEDALPLICTGAIVLAALAVAVYIILNMRAFSYERKKEGGNSIITISAKRNLEKVTVLARVEGETMAFERKRVRKGQSIDFSFPYSDKKAKVTVEIESGSAQVVEV